MLVKIAWLGSPNCDIVELGIFAVVLCCVLWDSSVSLWTFSKTCRIAADNIDWEIVFLKNGLWKTK